MVDRDCGLVYCSDMAKEITAEQRKKATVDVLNHVTEILFYFFQELEEDLDDDGVLDDFVSRMWDIAVVSMAASGLRINAINDDGSYSATFTPAKSIKEFMIKEDYADVEDAFFEDVAELTGVPFFGKHEKRLLD